MSEGEITNLAAAAVILDVDGRVLLVRENYGRHRWGLPGGVVEPTESPWDAAVREVAEETGLQFVPEGLVATYFLAAPRPGLRFIFSGKASGVLVLPDTDEIAEFGWFMHTELPKPMTHTGPLGIRDVLAGRRGHFEEVARL